MATEITEGFLLDLITKRRAGKFTAEELKFAVDHPEVIRYVAANQAIIEGLRNGMLTTTKRDPFPSELLASELIPEYKDESGQHKWGVIEDVQPIKFKVGDLEFPTFMKEGDPGYILGDELCRRAAGELKANLGLVAAKYLLEHQDEIPAEMQKFYIVLPGTLLRDSGGYLRVACLDFSEDRWVLDFYWVGSGFYGYDRLARCKSAAAPAAA